MDAELQTSLLLTALFLAFALCSWGLSLSLARCASCLEEMEKKQEHFSGGAMNTEGVKEMKLWATALRDAVLMKGDV